MVVFLSFFTGLGLTRPFSASFGRKFLFGILELKILGKPLLSPAGPPFYMFEFFLWTRFFPWLGFSSESRPSWPILFFTPAPRKVFWAMEKGFFSVRKP